MDYTSSGFMGQMLSKSVLRVIAFAQAGLAYLHYSYLDWIAKQSVPYTADGEYLEAWAALKNVIRESATVATGPIVVLGVPGSVMPTGTLLQSSDSTQYIVDTDITITGLSGSGTVTAVDVGLGGNAGVGIALSPVNSVTGVTSITTTAALTGGSDLEDTNSLRSRMLQVYQNPPQGGSASDYVTWALATPGVTRAWCNPGAAGLGSVVVYPMFDRVEADNAGFPVGSDGGAFAESRITTATGDQLTVANNIYPLRPVTALVFVAAPTPYAIDITIANINPGGVAIRAGIVTALTAKFVQIGSPLGMTVHQSDITGAIESVIGVLDFDLEIPVETTDIPIGSLPTLGNISYV